MRKPGATVLVVDDDRSVIASISLLLRRAGHRPEAATAPGEALDRLAAGGVDLVIQDMNFSRATTGSEGLELLERIRTDHPAVPVVLRERGHACCQKLRVVGWDKWKPYGPLRATRRAAIQHPEATRRPRSCRRSSSVTKTARWSSTPAGIAGSNGRNTAWSNSRRAPTGGGASVGSS